MKLLLRVFVIFSGILLTFLLVFYIYQRSLELKRYKLSFTQMFVDYSKLQNDFKNYKAKTQHLRQMKIISNSPSSKHIQVSNSLYNHANNVTGDVSIYYKNLTTGESVIIDGDRKYYMASLYKVILTLYILNKVRDGSLSLSDQVASPGGTIQEALDKTITESDNDYAQSLAQTYGWLNIQDAMKTKLGIDFSFDTDLNTSVTNMGRLFDDIALSLKIPDTESEYMLKLMSNQTHTNKLPKYLPKNVISHNKTGEFDDYSHDAGIFYTPKANYILIFMSKTQSPSATDEEMALMSKDVYDGLK